MNDTPPDCECCGMFGFELQVLPDEGAAYCPRCGTRTPLDIEPEPTQRKADAEDVGLSEPPSENTHDRPMWGRSGNA